MRIRLIAAGTRLPGWINEGYQDYAGRFGAEIRLELQEIPVTHRGKNADLARARAAEGERMLGAVGEGDEVVALELGGRSYSTEELARWLAQRQQSGRNLSLLVGGPDGLDPSCLQRASSRWSLSALTFPHGLVRVMVAEQLYRAHSLLKNHPYHRA